MCPPNDIIDGEESKRKRDGDDDDDDENERTFNQIRCKHGKKTIQYSYTTNKLGEIIQLNAIPYVSEKHKNKYRVESKFKRQQIKQKMIADNVPAPISNKREKKSAPTALEQREANRKDCFADTSAQKLIDNCCIYCGPYTGTLRNIKFDGLVQQLEDNSLIGKEKVLQCSKCSKKACLSCLNKFVFVMKDNCIHNKVTVSNKWVNDVITFVKLGGSYHPENFVGSCCNLNLPKHKDSRERNCRGDLHIVNANLIIPMSVNDNSIIVNGFGDDHPKDSSQKMNGLIHGVTTADTDYNLTSLNGRKSRFINEYYHEVELSHPFSQKQLKYKIKFLLYDGNFLPSNIAKTYLGSAPKLIDEACVVSSKPREGDDCDLIMILSTSNVDQRLHLIQTEFPNQSSLQVLNGKSSLSIQKSTQLYKSFLYHTERKGISIRKHVGGPVRLSPALDDFLSLEGTFPKKRKSVVFLPNSKDENNLIALYITNDDEKKEMKKKAICWKKYSQPTRGGTFYRKPELQKEQLLIDLVKCVYVTAKILNIVNEANFLPGKVCPHAVTKHLKKLQDANMHTNGTRFVNKAAKISAQLDFLTSRQTGAAQFNLLGHPCCYHIDNNSQGSALESKGFFVVTTDASIGTGRGGRLPPNRLRGGVGVASAVVGVVKCPPKD